MEAEQIKPYHHGALRSGLIEAGLALLSDPNAPEFSLRAVARAVGVNASAAYRHFPDKAALMRAMAQHGLDTLAARQLAASEAVGGGTDGLYASGCAYVRFALDNPALFRLMYSHTPRPDPSGDEQHRSLAMALLFDAARRFTPAGVDPQTFARARWAKVHGLAMLMLDGQLPADQAIIDAVMGADVTTAPSRRSSAAPAGDPGPRKKRPPSRT